jgi:electron transport complex protein RnfC
MRKIITLTGGAINNPGNYKARIGTKLSDLVAMAGGFRFLPTKVIVGGPLMGAAIFDIDVPVVKTTAGVIFMSREDAHIEPERNCIRCGLCVENCPMGLIPTELNNDILNESGANFTRHDGLDCIECGSCSYICPAKRRLAQAIRTFKRAEQARRAEAKK